MFFQRDKRLYEHAVRFIVHIFRFLARNERAHMFFLDLIDFPDDILSVLRESFHFVFYIHQFVVKLFRFTDIMVF